MNALLISALLGVLLLFASVFVKNRSINYWIAVVGAGALLVSNIAELKGFEFISFAVEGMFHFDRYALVLSTLLLFSVFCYLLLNGKSIAQVGSGFTDYLVLLFFICAGMIMVTSFSSLLILFLGIEIISIPLYILTASDKKNLKSNEAALKYFLLGSFSTGIMLMGMALFYGARGSFATIAAVDPTVIKSSLQLASILLLLFSISFKVSVVPFHFWTPDVYDGAPTVFTSFMATVVKVALFGAFIRLFEDTFSLQFAQWQLWVGVLIVLTLFVGNFTAVFQHSVKRMLSYSSIAQAGFMLLAVYAMNGTAKEGFLLYAISYSLATIGIFTVLAKMNDYSLEGFNGLGKKDPLTAASLTIFLLSLAGIPLTGGFLAKLFMIKAALSYATWLGIVAVLMAVVSVYYYFRVIQSIHFREDSQTESVTIPRSLSLLLLVIAALIIWLGIYPESIFGLLYF